MPNEAPYRLKLTEARDDPDAVRRAAEALGTDRSQIIGLIDAANARLARLYRVPKGPLDLSRDRLRVDDVAGLVRLSPRLELEVAPKFLSHTWSRWREDFFLIATLSRFGKLLVRDRLTAGFGDRGDLATLVGRTLVEEFWRHHRRPLRTYSRREWRDFSVEGDVDPVEFTVIDPDGYRQQNVQFTRTNAFNSVIHAAVSTLLTEVRDAEIRRQLNRVRGALAAQAVPRRHAPRAVPSRHRRWQTLYDLSGQVLHGFGVSLDSADHLLAPGYVLWTAKAWEDLVVTALRAGMPEAGVTAQQGFTLGQRDGTDFETTPDVTVETGSHRFLVDAKYKTRSGQERGRVVPADVYEGLAFLRASGATELALVYPAPPTAGEPQLGRTERFETITVDDMTIIAISAEVRGISSTNGFRRFAAQLSAGVRGGVDDPAGRTSIIRR
jgi:hypothetical protein